MAEDREDTLDKILIHMGATSKGIKSLEGGMAEVKADIKDVNTQLTALNHSSVKKQTCDAKHDDLKESIGEVKADVKYVRSRTGEQASIGPLVANPSQALPTLNPPEKKPKGILHWFSIAGGIIAIVTFFGGGLWAVIKAGRYLERVEQTIAVVQKQQAKVLKAASEPKVIHTYSTPPFPDLEPPKSVPDRKASP